ncbi:glutamine synthetase [Roseitranquillus sediminis]|uniref:glutamine synthetase n=1 Tax=Roseitranquillus sediminis TaxID=2809051 RepID=UPI001D0C550F|nr:glutamine synthetase [Roseitranquillus sediminis]MBM9594289.1 glutamine synthetase [Roseitranquillus sediminis]
MTEAFREKLRRHLRESRLPVGELARRSGVSGRAIERLFADETLGTEDELALAQVVGLDLSEATRPGRNPELDWLAHNREVRTVHVAVADLNGQARGKRLPARFAHKVVEDGARMPMSVLNVDIWGDDIENSPLVFETGDRDGILWPTERGFVPMPWLGSPSALLPTWMYTEEGQPFDGDPRHALARVVDRYAERGWRPVVATELEFYLIDDAGDDLQPPPSPRSGKRRLGGEILSLRALDAFDAFFTDLYDACEAMDIPAETAISEGGLGQYEINLVHGDPLKAADDAWLFKLLLRGLARRHGFAASFMAKPYAEWAGNGMHVHFSVLDEEGRNIFDDGGARGTDLLRQAIAGCLAALPDSTLILAPHGNSYDRMVPEAHAPTGIAWAYENRTAAIRIPASTPQARRIEHRVAGGDVSPYLLLTAVLGAALTGIEDEAVPPDPITGNAYQMNLPRLTDDWGEAIAAFERSALIRRILPRGLIRNYLMTKKQERQYYAELSQTERLDLYLDTV